VGGIPFSPFYFQSPFHLKVLSLPFHLGVSSDLNVYLGFGESDFIFLFYGSFQLPSMEFILSHLGSSSFNSDNELLEEIVINDQIAMQATIACVNI
jgi:hypothetical protein